MNERFKCLILQEINELLSGQLTEEDEAAVEEELAAIINDEMPEVPKQEPDVVEDVKEPSPQKGKHQ